MNLEVTPIILIIIGLILCLCGYKVQKVVITLTWFLLGFNLSSMLLPLAIEDETTCLIASLIIGVVLGAFGFGLEKLALFITVAYLTYIVVKQIPMLDIFPNDYFNFLLRIGISIGMGSLAVLLIRPILILASTGGGVALIYESLPEVIEISNQNILIAICIILAVISIIYQFKTTE